MSARKSRVRPVPDFSRAHQLVELQLEARKNMKKCTKVTKLQCHSLSFILLIRFTQISHLKLFLETLWTNPYSLLHGYVYAHACARAHTNTHAGPRVLVFSGFLFLFLCHWISFVLLLYDGSICTLSLDPLFLKLLEFQAWEWLFNPLNLWPQRQSKVSMEQKSRSKFLPWSGFAPRTSHWQSSIQPLDHRAPYILSYIL